MDYRLEINQTVTIKIKSKEPYSRSYLIVRENEDYEFKVSYSDKWVDFFIPCNADGFHNYILKDKHKRIPGHKCFKLCGTIGKNEQEHFAIGTSKLWSSYSNGHLHFFANDSKKRNGKGKFKYYWNNFGNIKLYIKRIQ